MATVRSALPISAHCSTVRTAWPISNFKSHNRVRNWLILLATCSLSGC
ncbi:Uncharacterised protein [Vibrio cholerae]|nr:Uncharacterised protein [Vibrio cholerae]